MNQNISLDHFQSQILQNTSVEITLKLADIALSIAEVLELVPGQLISMPAKMDEKIYLMVDNEVIAKARIVKHKDENTEVKTNEHSQYYLQILED